MSYQTNGYLRRLPPGFTSGNYFGFTLKKDFLFGCDDDGKPIAFTGRRDGCPIYIYKYVDDEWRLKEIGFEKLVNLLSS